jgi:hypothetical protein
MMHVFGDPDRFAFRVLPVSPRWAGDRSDACWAGLGISVGGADLTRHVVGGLTTVEDVVYVDLVPIAAWLRSRLPALLHEEGSRFFRIEDDANRSLVRWRETSWRRYRHEGDVSEAELADDQIRHEWEARHCLRFADTGAWLPDLTIICRDGQAVLSWAPRETAGHPRAQFLEAPGIVYLHASEFREGALGLIAFVEGSAVASEDVAILASPTWEGVIAAAAPEEERAFPYELMQAIDGRAPLDSAGYLATRDLVPVKGDACLAGKLDAATCQDRPARINRPAWAFVSGERAEDQGYEAATRLRAELGIDGHALPSGPLDDLLGERFGVGALHLTSAVDRNRMICGSRQDGAAAIAVINQCARQMPPWAERFELMRGLGHVLLDQPSPHGVIGAGGSPIAAGLRRRRSGAFAAEFLMPQHGVQRLIGHDLDAAAERFEEVMDAFGMGATATAHHLWNRGFLSSTVVRDALIDDSTASEPAP